MKKKDKRTNYDLQNTTLKTKDRPARTPLKNGDELMCYGRVGSSCSRCDTNKIDLAEKLNKVTLNA